MRGYLFGNACGSGEIFYHEEDHYAGKLAASPVQEKIIFLTCFYRYMHPDIVPVDIDEFNGGTADRYQSFLI